MTGPTNTTKPKSDAPTTDHQPDRAPEVREQADSAPEVTADEEVGDLARAQEDVSQRARRLVAGELVAHGRDDHDEQWGRDRLLSSARAGLLAELQEKEQERARRQLADAARGSEDAVAGVVQGIATVIRSLVPAALVRPEDTIEATFALADQGLRVGRRLALTMTTSVRSSSPAA